MGGRIDCYLDVGASSTPASLRLRLSFPHGSQTAASFYSYVAFADLVPNLEKLRAHGVQVEFHPVLIAAVNNLSGNKPPWMLPAKAKYIAIDSTRAAERVSRPGLVPPEDFMSMSLTTSPLRALHYIKVNYPEAKFLAAMEFMFHKLWTPPNVNLTQDEGLRATLIGAEDAGGAKLFSNDDVRNIMEGRDSMKETLKAETKRVVDLGAFGAPWIWATNAQGQGQAFFGSDRFNHIYRHLGIPFQDITILPASKL